MADLDESTQDSLLETPLYATKEDEAVVGDITGDSNVDDSLEDPVIFYLFPKEILLVTQCGIPSKVSCTRLDTPVCISQSFENTVHKTYCCVGEFDGLKD